MSRDKCDLSSVLPLSSATGSNARLKYEKKYDRMDHEFDYWSFYKMQVNCKEKQNIIEKTSLINQTKKNLKNWCAFSQIASTLILALIGDICFLSCCSIVSLPCSCHPFGNDVIV